MKIVRISENANDVANIYDGLKKALGHLNLSNVGKAKSELKKAIKDLEKVRPHLRYKDYTPRRKF